PPAQTHSNASISGLFSRLLERFRAKWIPVRVKKARQNKRLEPRSDSIKTERPYAMIRKSVKRFSEEIMLKQEAKAR
ncbi:hypothetical protein ACFFWD_41850, partial [Bradyrhizobium erythrophlei]